VLPDRGSVWTDTSDSSRIHTIRSSNIIERPWQMDLIRVLGVFRRDSLPMHIHPHLLRVRHIKLGRPIAPNRGSVAEHSLAVVVSLIH